MNKKKIMALSLVLGLAGIAYGNTPRKAERGGCPLCWARAAKQKQQGQKGQAAKQQQIAKQH